MAKNNNLTDYLTDLANAIREKESTTSAISPQDFNARIRALAGLSEVEAVNYTDVPTLVKDIADTIREAEGSSETINPQDFSARIASLETGGSVHPPEYYVPLYIEALEPITISFANTHEYSKDNTTWISASSSTSVSAQTSEKVYYRASGLTATSTSGIGNFTISGKCNLGGNIMSMIHKGNYINKLSLTQACSFYCMFAGQIGIIDASRLSLPATTLTDSCYYGMFEGCTGLVEAPVLPATKLAQKCYLKMFYNCTGLVKAPALPATSLTESCYNNMFTYCSNLKEAPELNAMVMGDYSYSNMFQRCTRLVKAPALPATKLSKWCYNNMFLGCISLEVAPILPALTLEDNCYRQMLKECGKINYVKAMFLSTPSESFTLNWLSEVASAGTFVKNKAATWTDKDSGSTIPVNWTIQYAEL